ncbi:MAG: ribosome silencing factor [Halocynthiibacter sp.]
MDLSGSTHEQQEALNTSKKPSNVSEELIALILRALEENKAEDIVNIDLKGRSQIADYMVVCSGRSSRQVAAIAEKITAEIKSTFNIVPKLEGKGQGDWVLIDTGDVVVHVFRPEVREFYQLEKMWLSPADDG